MVRQHPEMVPQRTEMIKQHCGTISADDYSNITVIITKFYIKNYILIIKLIKTVEFSDNSLS